MATEKTKANSAPKKEPAAASKSAAAATPAKAESPKSEGSKPEAAKPDGAKPDGAKPDGAKPDGAKSDGAKTESTKDAPTSYSRGEGQKVVTQAYKDNWNAIFAKKKKNTAKPMKAKSKKKKR